MECTATMLKVIIYLAVALQLVGSIAAARAKCGRSTADENRIVFGTPAVQGANPWIVSLELYIEREDLWEHQCAGTLLDKRWILTAAHCFKLTTDVTKWRVVAGQYDRAEPECSEQILHVQNILMHPDYQATDHRHDIAMVLVDGKFRTGGNFVRSVCIPSQDMIFSDETPCTIAGWGQHMFTIDKSAYTKLLYYNSTILNREECNREAVRVAERDMIHVGAISDEMICIKSEFDRSKPYRERGSGGTCGGDSGGPLICKYGDYQYVAGVVSWSLRRPCGYTHDVFTRLHVYLDWVNKTRKNKPPSSKRPTSPEGC